MSEPNSPNLPDRGSEFFKLYSAHQRGLYYFIVTLCGNTEDANEILAETNLALWENFGQFKKGTNFLAWARQIARHRVLNHRRKHFRDTTLLDPHVMDQVVSRLADDDVAYDQLLRKALEHCLTRLKAADRKLVEQRYAPEGSVKQIAADLNRTPNGISQSLGRIRGLLYDCIRRTLLTWEEMDCP